MSGPAAVIVAGAVTTWIAFASADGLVAEDYYKQGLGINRVLAREAKARELGILVEITRTASEISIQMQGQAPEALFVHLAHATRAGHDVRLRLAPATTPGVYHAELPSLPPGRWRMVIEDPRASWRIVKETP
jgi:hypothetical protein